MKRTLNLRLSTLNYEPGDRRAWSIVSSELNVHTAGTLFYAPKGVRHGPHIARTEVISLTVFDGPLTVA